MRFAATLALGLFPAAALAQDVHGTISGTLDLEEVEWTILEGENLPAPAWSETPDGIEVDLYAYAQSETPTRDNAIAVTFTVTGDPTEAAARDPQVTLARPGGRDLMANGENIDLQLNSFSFQGDRLAVTGDLFATMTPGGSEGLIVDSGADAATFDGDFQATINASE